jgi:hypothetical protein
MFKWLCYLITLIFCFNIMFPIVIRISKDIKRIDVLQFLLVLLLD